MVNHLWRFLVNLLSHKEFWDQFETRHGIQRPISKKAPTRPHHRAVLSSMPGRQQPDHKQDKRDFHGVACHGCVFLSEASCESMNDFLDRNLVVRTIASNRRHFFEKG